MIIFMSIIGMIIVGLITWGIAHLLSRSNESKKEAGCECYAEEKDSLQ